MKSELMKLDPKNTGRVPLSKFYSQPKNAVYQFVESVDYLREVGAIEELSSGGPSVRIANYILAPTNCIATSSFFSVCCLSDCGQLMGEVEHMVQAPTASPQVLLGIVGNLSLVNYDGEQVVTSELKAKLHTVAAHHAGTVPLHGRLFAQWMHFAFPLECPFPHVAGNASVMSAKHWRSNTPDFRVKPEDKARFIQEGKANAQLLAADPLALEWNEEEVLPLQEPQRRGIISGVVRMVVQFSMILMLIHVGMVGLRFAKSTSPEKGA